MESIYEIHEVLHLLLVHDHDLLKSYFETQFSCSPRPHRYLSQGLVIYYVSSRLEFDDFYYLHLYFAQNGFVYHDFDHSSSPYFYSTYSNLHLSKESNHQKINFDFFTHRSTTQGYWSMDLQFCHYLQSRSSHPKVAYSQLHCFLCNRFIHSRFIFDYSHLFSQVHSQTS